ncbi:MAG TPA: winged helix-turn-helix domain-containing protein [Terriglobales bacterium]|nr:winged helix-turn-helix domain-containing protein [Terriglobales bacterium]
MQVTAREQQHVRFGPFTVDLGSRELWNGEGKISLQEKPFQILAILLEQPGDLVTREELQRQLWADTIVDFEHSINTAVKKLREALQDDPEQPRYIETLPRRGYRFIGQIEESPEQVPLSDDLNQGLGDKSKPERKVYRRNVLIGLVVLAVAILIGLSARAVRSYWMRGKISEEDAILLADFTNNTADPLFDDSLRLALATQLRQSPFFNFVSDRRVGRALRQMGRSPNERITMDVGREICLRIGCKAVVGGIISNRGAGYRIELDAVESPTGYTIAKEAGDATSKNDTLAVLSGVSSDLRRHLGESLASVQKFDTPFRVTTPSLPALKSYSMAIRLKNEKGDVATVPFLKAAIELDPNFAMAYGGLAVAYGNMNEPTTALEYATKAYELREHTTQLEKIALEGEYFSATGELEKEMQTFQTAIAEYSRDFATHGDLANDYAYLAQYDKAIAEYQRSLQLAPDNATNNANLAAMYLFVNRLDEAQATIDEALARKMDSGDLRFWAYAVAFARGDKAQMQQQLDWAKGRPGNEDALLSQQSNTEAYYGRLNEARNFSHRAVDSAVHADSKEAAASWQVNAALREAELGFVASAKQGVASALALSRGRDVMILAALALARAGDTTQAAALVKELEKNFPSNTLLKAYWIPAINATIEINRNNSVHAAALLKSSLPYEQGAPVDFLSNLYPAYVRGRAYLSAGDGKAAVAEFKKLLEHPGIVGNFVTGSLSHLQIGRAYAMAGERDKALAAYQDFFALWKDADSQIPILGQARAEYKKLLGKS